MKLIHIAALVVIIAALMWMFATDNVGNADEAYARHMNCQINKECSK